MKNYKPQRIAPEQKTQKIATAETMLSPGNDNNRQQYEQRIIKSPV
jgi:hypothetical protein